MTDQYTLGQLSVVSLLLEDVRKDIDSIRKRLEDSAPEDLPFGPDSALPPVVEEFNDAQQDILDNAKPAPDARYRRLKSAASLAYDGGEFELAGTLEECARDVARSIHSPTTDELPSNPLHLEKPSGEYVGYTTDG